MDQISEIKIRNYGVDRNKNIRRTDRDEKVCRASKGKQVSKSTRDGRVNGADRFERIKREKNRFVIINRI